MLAAFGADWLASVTGAVAARSRRRRLLVLHVALWSSWDTIEIAVRDGSAADRLGVDRGVAVTVTGG
jgi:hypothetical protein